MVVTGCTSLQNQNAYLLSDIETSDSELSCTFFNNTDKTIQEITIALAQDSQEVSIQHYTVYIPPFSSIDLTMSLPSDYDYTMTTDQYLYATQIIYTDGTVWNNPYGTSGIYLP